MFIIRYEYEVGQCILGGMNYREGFIVTYCKDVSLTKDFWEALEAVVVEFDDEKVVVALGSHEIHYVLESEEAFESYQFATGSVGRGRGVLLYVEVADLERLRSRTLEAGSRRVTEIQDNHWGGREVLFEDPDGYCVVAYQMK